MHNLKHLGYDNWNDALDSYLDYKNRNETKNNLSFDEWYSFKTRVKNINEKIKAGPSSYNSKTEKKKPKKVQPDSENLTPAENEILDMLNNLNLDIEMPSVNYTKEESYAERILREAEELSRRAHIGQLRHNGKPYIQHIEDVVRIIKSNGNSNTAEAIIVGWLHDVITTTSYTSDFLLEQPWVTKRMITAIDALEIGYFESYLEYVDRLKRNNLAWVVKLAKLMSLMDNQPTQEEQYEIEKFCDYLEDDM
jgi:hypothetical protein